MRSTSRRRRDVRRLALLNKKNERRKNRDAHRAVVYAAADFARGALIEREFVFATRLISPEDHRALGESAAAAARDRFQTVEVSLSASDRGWLSWFY